MAHVTQSETAEMIRLYGDGYSVNEICACLGRTRETIRRHLIDAGHYYPRPQRSLDDHEVAAVIQWYQLGVRIHDIMARFGITSTSVVYRHLRKRGVPLRGR